MIFLNQLYAFWKAQKSRFYSKILCLGPSDEDLDIEVNQVLIVFFSIQKINPNLFYFYV